MADCFATDSTVNVSWFNGSGAGFVRESRRMASGGGWGGLSVHRLSPPVVHIDGDRALAELPLIIEFRIKIDSVEADLASFCRSQYRAEKIDRAWRIVSITSAYEKDTLTASVPGTTLDINPHQFAGYRPSCRCLAWFWGRRGAELRSDLLGDDEPDAVQQQYEAEAAWLADDRSISTAKRTEGHS